MDGSMRQVIWQLYRPTSPASPEVTTNTGKTERFQTPVKSDGQPPGTVIQRITDHDARISLLLPPIQSLWTHEALRWVASPPQTSPYPGTADPCS